MFLPGFQSDQADVADEVHFVYLFHGPAGFQEVDIQQLHVVRQRADGYFRFFFPGFSVPAALVGKSSRVSASCAFTFSTALTMSTISRSEG